jgi:HEAT repeat protein
MTKTASTPPPDATLFVSSHCPHCPTVLQAMAELVKTGRIRQLQVFNLEHASEEAASRGIRSVPWIRIGPFELTGLHGESELAKWAERAASAEGYGEYLVELIGNRQLKEAADLIRRDPGLQQALIALLGNPATELSIRIGASALMEELAGSVTLRALLPSLTALGRHEDARIRGDAAHYLGLSGDRTAIDELRRLLQDADAEVREIAAESLAAIEGGVG